MRGGGYNHPINKYWVDMRNLADVAKWLQIMKSSFFRIVSCTNNFIFIHILNRSESCVTIGILERMWHINSAFLCINLWQNFNFTNGQIKWVLIFDSDTMTFKQCNLKIVCKCT